MTTVRNHSGHANPILKTYDVLRCFQCNELIKVPKEDMEYKCPHCGRVNSFAIEEVLDADESKD